MPAPFQEPPAKLPITVINVRLEGPTEDHVRALAKQWDLQISTVKDRGGVVHLYGSKAVLG